MSALCGALSLLLCAIIAQRTAPTASLPATHRPARGAQLDAHFDHVDGLDDAGGRHAGEAAVEKRLGRLPSGVVGHGGHGCCCAACCRAWEGGACGAAAGGGAWAAAARRLSPRAAAARGRVRLCGVCNAGGRGGRRRAPPAAPPAAPLPPVCSGRGNLAPASQWGTWGALPADPVRPNPRTARAPRAAAAQRLSAAPVAARREPARGQRPDQGAPAAFGGGCLPAGGVRSLWGRVRACAGIRWRCRARCSTHQAVGAASGRWAGGFVAKQQDADHPVPL